MAFDLKQGIDLKELGPKIKALFAKDSNILGNKLIVFSIVSILVTLVLIYSIYEISDNQSVYDEANNNYNNTSIKLSRLETKFKKTLDGNKVYFKQLMVSPKTKSELSAKVTGLVNQYNLLLKSIDLNAKVGKQNNKGVVLIVSGSYLNLIRFSSEMNEILSASKLVNLAVRKPRKGNSLIMELAIIFSAPPSANALPLPPTNTVKLLNKGSIFDGFLNMLISSANASEESLLEILPVGELTNLPPLQDKTKIKGLSLFQTAHQEARSNGLIKFEFTNKAGETKVYLTGLKEPEEVLVAKQAVNIKLQKATPLNNFQKAYVDALVQGQKLFEYTNTQGETAVYKTDEKGFKLAGFVENTIDNNQESNTQESAEPESLRDPFASPGDAKAPKINRSSSGEGSKNQYYLSGVIASDHLELCVIITPLGESKIYHIGDKLTDKIKITGINDNAILINNSTKNIVIGDEVR